MTNLMKTQNSVVISPPKDVNASANNNTKQFQNKNNSSQNFNPAEYEEERKNAAIKIPCFTCPAFINTRTWDKYHPFKLFYTASDLITHCKWALDTDHKDRPEYEWLNPVINHPIMLDWFYMPFIDLRDPEYVKHELHLRPLFDVYFDKYAYSPLIIRVEIPYTNMGRTFTKHIFLYWESYARGVNYIINLIAPRLPPNASIHEFMMDKANHVRRAYLDIDYEVAKHGPITEDEFITLLCSIISKYASGLKQKLNGCRIYRSYCPENTKFSAHVVFDNVGFKNGVDAKNYFDINVSPLLTDREWKCIDEGVYKTSQSLRLFGQSKGGKREKILAAHIQGDFAHDDLEQLYYDEQVDSSLNEADNKYLALLESLITYRGQGINIVNIPRKNNNNQCDQLVSIDDKEINDIIERHRNQYLGNEHSYRDHVSNEGGTIINFDRVAPSHCIICDKVHENENSMWWTISSDRYINMHCRRNPGKYICIEEGTGKTRSGPTTKERLDIAFQFEPRKFTPSSDKQYLNPIITEISQPKITDKYKFDHTLVVMSQMGTGKTEMVEEYIADHPSFRVLIVAFRKSFTSSIAQRFSKLGFMSYIGATKEEIRCADRVIVQYESLHKIGLSKFDLIVLDELEQILNCMTNCVQDINKTREPNFNTLMRLMIDLNKVIVMDATFGARSDSLIQNKRGQYEMLINRYEPHKERNSILNLYECEAEFDNEIINSINRGQKVVIPTNEKAKGMRIFGQIKHRCAALNPRILFIHGDNSDDQDIKDIMSDVNARFINYDVLIYTSTISAGVSFTQKHFDVLFAYFDTNIGDVTTAYQMLGRVRDISTSQYNLFVRRGPFDYRASTRAHIIDEHDKIIEQLDKYGYRGINLNDDRTREALSVPQPTGGTRGQQKQIRDKYAYRGDMHECIIAQQIHTVSSRNNFLGYLVYYSRKSGMAVNLVSTSEDFADKKGAKTVASKQLNRLINQEIKHDKLCNLSLIVEPCIPDIIKYSAETEDGNTEIPQSMLNQMRMETEFKINELKAKQNSNKKHISLLERVLTINLTNPKLTSDLVKPYKLIMRHNRLIRANTTISDYYQQKFDKFIANKNIELDSAEDKYNINIEVANTALWYIRERICLDILRMCGADINQYNTFVQLCDSFAPTTKGDLMTKINDPATGLKNYISNEPLFAAACNKDKRRMQIPAKIDYRKFSKFMNPLLESTLGVQFANKNRDKKRKSSDNDEIILVIAQFEDNTVIRRGNYLRYHDSFEIIKHNNMIYVVTQPQLTELLNDSNNIIEQYDEFTECFILL
jgi:hypothetical protein